MLGLFAHPEILPALVLAPAAGLLLLLLQRTRARRLLRTVGPRATLLSGDLCLVRRRVRALLFATALAFSVLAFAGPRWGESGDLQRRGVNVLVCLDVSRSMLARDMEPDRLQCAKREIRAMAERTAGDYLGLVVFAGNTRLLVPLTRDIASYLDLLDQADPLAVPSGGTDLGAALATALDALDAGGDEPGVILLLTDGDDLGGRGLAVARTCGERGLPVHCVGFGTELGAKIPVETAAGEAFLRDRAGREVIAKLDAAGLRDLAEASGGEYRTAGTGTLEALFTDSILPHAREAFVVAEGGSGENRFQWPLLLAFLLFIVDLCVSERRR